MRAVITGRRIATPTPSPAPVIAALDEHGKLVAILVPADENQLKPRKVFQTTLPSA